MAAKGVVVEKKTNALEDAALGGVAAIVSKTIAAPIERIKLLIQNQSESAKITKPYKGVLDCLVRVPKEQGVMSFWRGNGVNVLRYFPTQALNFMFKERYKQMLAVPKTASKGKRLASNVTAGGLAGATSLLVVYPLDFARTRLAMDTGKAATDREFQGLMDCLKKTASKNGVFKKGGVYNGFFVSVFGIFFYRGAYFGLYDTFKDSMKKDTSFWTKFAVSYSVTVAAGLISYPIDTIRRRMQMTSGVNAGKYKNALDCAVKILKNPNEGVGALFKGAEANILRGLCGALVLVGFDECKSMYIDYKYAEPATGKI